MIADEGLQDWLSDFAMPADLEDDARPDLDPDLEGADTVDFGDRSQLDELLPPAGAIRWEELTGEERATTWERLRVFVEWWTDRYGISTKTLPSCWFRHPAIVEELTALMSARTASFSDEDQGLGPIGWHERAALVRQRIETTHYRGECGTGHIAATPRPDLYETDWRSWIKEETRDAAAPIDGDAELR
ncbi:hypothetical protein [Gulosibacter sediminis]|uniref:hypothetical protein n=1 Tax=Gulosibacter sediminis TaxID=1729695 RepID=UPI0024A7EB09|nr:hypothetical protein [Gulosibacter sediminis]